jgi:hypothetical protein
LRDRVLKPLAAPGAFGDMFNYADFSNAPGIADPNFWYDEIHPKESGFAQFAGLLNQQIRSVLPIRKQQAARYATSCRAGDVEGLKVFASSESVGA